jgi:hypothetical protein
VNAAPGDLSAPMQRSPAHIFEIDEAFSPEEAFPDETYMAFHDRFVPDIRMHRVLSLRSRFV